MKVYTVDEVAKQLKLNPETIRVYIRGGDLQASYIGKSYRITEEDLVEFIEAHKIKGDKNNV